MTSFLGLPIEGQITKSGRSSVKQRPVEELGPYLEALLDTPGVEAIRWRQYTPYFNDGDVCEFGIEEVTVKLEGGRTAEYDYAEDDEGAGYDGEYGDGYLTTYDDQLRGTKGDYNSKHKWVPGDDVHPAYEPLEKLAREVGSGAFNDVLKDTFGDHAKVTVRKTGITVDFYDHD